jgi:hypothetical protein
MVLIRNPLWVGYLIWGDCVAFSILAETYQPKCYFVASSLAYGRIAKLKTSRRSPAKSMWGRRRR